jgi:predicted RNA-binding Zn-ribbon protein involved in translation (DUF1610 family)
VGPGSPGPAEPDRPRSDPTALDLESRAAYLGGLVKGLALASESEQGRVLGQVVELLGDVARVVGRLAVTAGTTDQVARTESRPTFIACECPRCGEDVFLPAESPREASAGGRRGLRLVEPSRLPQDCETASLRGPAARETPSPDTESALPREFQLTCPNCGEVFLVREDPHSEAWGRGVPTRPPRRPKP